MGIRSKDKRDIYYMMSKENGYRARSVYKLKHIDDSYNIFENIKNVVDLCGAPGSWSQYVAEKNKKILTVDLQDMNPIEGVHIIKEDITSLTCVSKILDFFQNDKVDLCLCDGAPDITGIHDIDEYFQSQLISKALEISLKITKLGGSFIGKIFRGKYCKHVVHMFKRFYKEVVVLKPKASRHASIECFIYCKGLFNYKGEVSINIENEDVEDFEIIGCGNGPDSDLTIDTVKSISLKPLSTPIKPPYEESINFRKK